MFIDFGLHSGCPLGISWLIQPSPLFTALPSICSTLLKLRANFNNFSQGAATRLLLGVKVGANFTNYTQPARKLTGLTESKWAAKSEWATRLLFKLESLRIQLAERESWWAIALACAFPRPSSGLLSAWAVSDCDFGSCIHIRSCFNFPCQELG